MARLSVDGLAGRQESLLHAESVGPALDDIAASQVAEQVLVLIADVGTSVAQLARDLVLRVALFNLGGDKLDLLLGSSFSLLGTGATLFLSGKQFEAYLLNALVNID